MVANLIGPGTPSLSSPITRPVGTPSASRLIGPTLMKQAKQVLRREGTLSRQRSELCECVAETMREQGSVCLLMCVEVGGDGREGGRFFMQLSRLQWADSPP